VEHNDAMETDEGKEPFEIKNFPEKDLVLLKVNVPLEMDRKYKFTDACRALLEVKETNLVIDLSRADKIFSLFLGSIADLHMSCEKQGKNLTVLANRKIMKRFSQTSFTQFLNIKVV